jgi:hypothetical protein
MCFFYLVNYPNNCFPQRIAYKSYRQALKNVNYCHLPKSRIHIIYVENDETRINFHEDHVIRGEKAENELRNLVEEFS